MSNEVKIKLTDAQKEKIREATGKDLPEIRVENFGSNPAVSPTEHTLSARKGAKHTLSARKGAKHTMSARKGAKHTMSARKGAKHTLSARKGARINAKINARVNARKG